MQSKLRVVKVAERKTAKSCRFMEDPSPMNLGAPEERQWLLKKFRAE